MENKFKILTFLDSYVNEPLLSQGIYMTSTPYLHSNDTTIETLVSNAQKVKDMLGPGPYISEEYIENLKACTLVEVELKINL